MASPSAAFCLRTKVSRHKSRRWVHEARSNCLRLFERDFHSANLRAVTLTLCLFNWVRQGERSTRASFIVGHHVGEGRGDPPGPQVAKAGSERATSILAHQLHQLRHVRRDPSRLIAHTLLPCEPSYYPKTCAISSPDNDSTIVAERPPVTARNTSSLVV